MDVLGEPIRRGNNNKLNVSILMIPSATTEQGTESRAGEGLSLASAFFDDTSLLGPPEAVAAAMRDLFELACRRSWVHECEKTSA